MLIIFGGTLFATAQTYDQNDVSVINNLITNNGLIRCN
jgi:hypothetical protein